MPYNISFISLGCAKNQVNCEQMMASVQAAGHTIQAQPEGADVVVVDDLSKGHREALKGGRLYVGSVADRAFLDDVFSREPIEAVIHFAAFSLVGESMQVPEQYFRNNVTAGLTLIETMLAHKVPYLVFSSTAATFGEPEYVPIDEAHPQNPTNPYGESKLIVEKMLKWCDLAHGLKFCALRSVSYTHLRAHET